VIKTSSMAEDRPPPTKDTEPRARDDDSVPQHRVVWDHGPLGPPPTPVPPAPEPGQPGNGGMPRRTIRMVRPNMSAPALAWIHAEQRNDAPAEPPVDSVVEAAPTTARVPQAPPPPSTRAPAQPQSTLAYGRPQPEAQQPQAQPPRQSPSRALTQTAAMVRAPSGTPAPLASRAPQARPGAQPQQPQQPQQPPRVTSRRIDPRLVMLTEPDSARAGSFRRLRDNLLAKGLPRVLAVSSAAPHEGKTTCAVNLALALAEHTPARLLLIDGNFFQPSLAEVFSIDERTPAPAGDAWLAPYRLAELTPCLHVAAIVLRPGEVLPRFDKHRFDVLLDRLCRIGYDHLIIDAPALEGSPMVSQLLGGVDGVLLAVRSGQTTARALRRAVDEIAAGKAMGIALVDADP
jgi:Mrp family chromosome partitioning ATPase